MKIKLEIDDNIIKLIKSLRFIRFSESTYGIDTYELYGGGDFLYEVMARILGKENNIIKGTECDYDGAKYDKETMEMFYKYDDFMVNHIEDIEDIMHQFCDKGGIKPGIYTCIDNIRIWSFEPFN